MAPRIWLATDTADFKDKTRTALAKILKKNLVWASELKRPQNLELDVCIREAALTDDFKDDEIMRLFENELNQLAAPYGLTVALMLPSNTVANRRQRKRPVPSGVQPNDKLRFAMVEVSVTARH